MAALGLESYRFSIAWPRVQPDGRGRAEPRAASLLPRGSSRACCERGIEPIATLYHWDLPQALQDAGGWAARDTALRFAEYAAAMARRARRRRRRSWITHNEPWVVAFLGHADGRQGAGHPRLADGAARSSHHLLLSHGLAVDALRARGRRRRSGSR